MDYIEIQEGITINIRSIESLERLEGNKTKVRILGQRMPYVSTYPYETLLSLLKEEDTVDKKAPAQKLEETVEKLDKVLNKAQHFAG